MDVKEDALRQILIKNIITKRFGEENPKRKRQIIKGKEKEVKANKENNEDIKPEMK